MLVLGSICLCSWMMAQPGQQNTVQQSSITEPCNNIIMMTLFRFDMEGEELYSVKWYKAGHEFYRYIPGDRSAAQ